MKGGGSSNPQGGGTNLLFGKIFPKSCMKVKEIGLGGGEGTRPWPPLDPPMK